MEQSLMEFQSEILVVPREVDLKLRKSRITGKIRLHSTIPVRSQLLRARKSNSTWLILKLINTISVFVMFLSDRRLKSHTSTLLQWSRHNELS